MISLDPTGIDFQMKMYESLVKRSKELGGVGGDSALATPTEQSGVSRAWQFKTGEQRVLFLLTKELSKRTNELMDHVASDLGIDPDKVGVEFDDSFDGLGDKDDVQVTSESTQVFSSWSPLASANMVKKLARRLMPDLDRETMEAIDAEIDSRVSEQGKRELERSEPEKNESDEEQDEENEK